MYEDGPVLTLDDPALMLFGWHTVEIRSRLKGQSRTLDPNPFRTRVLIDLGLLGASFRLPVASGAPLAAFLGPPWASWDLPGVS